MVPADLRPARALPAEPQRQGRPRGPAGAGPGPGRRAPRARRTRTEAERRTADVFGRGAGNVPLGVQDSFFELGGDSILSIRLASRLAEAFGADITPREVFTRPTPAGLARLLTLGTPPAPGAPPSSRSPATGPRRCRSPSNACGSWTSSRPAGPSTSPRSRCGCAAGWTSTPWRGAARTGGPPRVAAHHLRQRGRGRRPAGPSAAEPAAAAARPVRAGPAARRCADCCPRSAPAASTCAGTRCCGRGWRGWPPRTTTCWP